MNECCMDHQCKKAIVFHCQDIYSNNRALYLSSVHRFVDQPALLSLVHPDPALLGLGILFVLA